MVRVANDFSALYQRALTAIEQQALPLALERIEACLKACTEPAEQEKAELLRGDIALRLNLNTDAKACFTRLVQFAPSPQAHRGLSICHARLGEARDAIAQARAGLSLAEQKGDPSLVPSLLYNLGCSLQMAGERDDAVRVYRQLLEAAPNHLAAHNNLGLLLERDGKPEAAIEHYWRCLEIDPRAHGPRTNLGHALLTTGHYAEGWRYFESRCESPDMVSNASPLPSTLQICRWDDEVPHQGAKRLLVLDEQGLGDMLQFCRFVPMLLDRFETVALVCRQPLKRLLTYCWRPHGRRLVLLDRIPSDPLAWDRYVPLLSLAKIFATDIEAIAGAVPYLSANPQLARRWVSRLEANGVPGKPRIGVVWAGGHSELEMDRWRSIAPLQMDTLFSWPGAQWVSLQKPETDAKRLMPEQRHRVIDWMHEMKDFADTAALVAALDLVISVDTSVAHLAAAMGKPVWLLNRFPGCWRWMRGREDSPWYPSVRIFTQKQRGNWQDVLDDVLSALQREYPPRSVPR